MSQSNLSLDSLCKQNHFSFSVSLVKKVHIQQFQQRAKGYTSKISLLFAPVLSCNIQHLWAIFLSILLKSIYAYSSTYIFCFPTSTNLTIHIILLFTFSRLVMCGFISAHYDPTIPFNGSVAFYLMGEPWSSPPADGHLGHFHSSLWQTKSAVKIVSQCIFRTCGCVSTGHIPRKLDTCFVLKYC